MHLRLEVCRNLQGKKIYYTRNKILLLSFKSQGDSLTDLAQIKIYDLAVSLLYLIHD